MVRIECHPCFQGSVQLVGDRISQPFQVTHPDAPRFPQHPRETAGTKRRPDIARVKSPESCAYFFVRNYLFRIFDKVGVSTRVELVLYCLQGKHNNGTSAELAS
jgi:hypothetical protein